MESYGKIVNDFHSLTIVPKLSFIDIFGGTDYTFVSSSNILIPLGKCKKI